MPIGLPSRWVEEGHSLCAWCSGDVATADILFLVTFWVVFEMRDEKRVWRNVARGLISAPLFSFERSLCNRRYLRFWGHSGEQDNVPALDLEFW